MRMTSHLPTARGSSLMQTAAKHFAHKTTVEQDETSARIDFNGGVGVMSVDESGIGLVIESETAEGAERVRGVLEGHLLRFAHREEPQPLVWTQG